MKRKALVLLVSMSIPALAMAGSSYDGYSFIGGLPLVERARVTPVNEYAFSVTLPDGGLSTGDGGFETGLLWHPSLGVSNGLGSKFGLTLSTPMKPGGTIFAKYGLASGPNPLAVGLKLSGNGDALPGANPGSTDTSYHGGSGQLYVTPLFMMDSKPGSLQSTFDAGPVIEYSKGQYGHGYSLDIGAEYDLFTKPFWTNGPIGALYVAGDWRPWSNDAYIKANQAPVTFTIGVSFEEIAHVGTKW